MAWINELKQPSFRGIEFNEKNVTLSRGKKGGIREIPGTDGGPAEDIGNTTRQFNVELFLNGDDYLDLRDDFIDALNETGPGELVLSSFGQLNALPVSYTEVESTQDRGGEARFTVVFSEAGEETIPVVSDSNKAVLAATLDTTEELLIENFAEKVNYSLADLIAQAQDDFQNLSNLIDETIAKIVDASLINEFNALVSVIDGTINQLIQNDLFSLASSYSRLLRFPGKVIGKFSQIVDTYTAFFTGLTEIFDDLLPNEAKKNQSIQIETFATAAIVGFIEGARNASYDNRVEAINAFNDILDYDQNIQDKLDELEVLFSTEEAQDQYLQDYDTANSRQQITAQIVNTLNLQAFNLDVEKSIILAQPKSLLILSYELLGDVERIDELIDINNITDTTLIPAGTRITYYA